MNNTEAFVYFLMVFFAIALRLSMDKNDELKKELKDKNKT